MKTNVSQTSISSYHLDIKNGKEPNQCEQVLEAIKDLGGKATINQLFRKTNIFPSTISARLNNLIKKDLVEKTEETVKDSYTKKANQLYAVV